MEVPTEIKEDILQKIRDARDNHNCPNDRDDFLECTCEYYDRVIDHLEEYLTTPNPHSLI